MGTAAAVAEVHLTQRLGSELAEVVLVDVCFLGLKEAGGVPGRQGQGEVTHAGLVGAVDGGGVAEPRLHIDHDAARGGRGLFRLRSDLRLPARADLTLESVDP